VSLLSHLLQFPHPRIHVPQYTLSQPIFPL
jgi:hypothetical protein